MKAYMVAIKVRVLDDDADYTEEQIQEAVGGALGESLGDYLGGVEGEVEIKSVECVRV